MDNKRFVGVFIEDIFIKDNDDLIKLQRKVEMEENLLKLKAIGVDNPIEEDIPLYPFYAAGIGKEEAMHMKNVCDKTGIDYNTAILLRGAL